jgi:hypothetical protein
MRRFLLVAAALLLGGTVMAQADTTHWTAVHPPQSDSQLRAAARYCAFQTGGDPPGVPTPAVYKQCMRSQGFIYTNTTRDGDWVNRRGMDCHPTLNGGGSECDSVW